MHARNAIEEPSPSTPSSTTGKGVRNASIAPALTQCFQLQTSRRFHSGVTTGLRVLTDRAIASISMDTQLWEHCAYDHRTMEPSGSRCPGGLEPAQSAGYQGQGPSRAPSPPRRGPAPTAGAAARPGRWHFRSENPAPRAGPRGASGFVLKNRVSQVTPSRG